MAKYEVSILKRLVFRCIYCVDADDPEEAGDKAIFGEGELIEEIDLNRYPYADPSECLEIEGITKVEQRGNND